MGRIRSSLRGGWNRKGNPSWGGDERSSSKHEHNKHKRCNCGWHSTNDTRKRSKARVLWVRNLDMESIKGYPQFRKWAMFIRLRGRAKRDKRYGTR